MSRREAEQRRAWQLEAEVGRLRREGDDLRRILRSLGEGVVAVDRAGVLLHANPVAVELLGLDAATCLGSHMFVAIPHPDVCAAIEEVMRATGPQARRQVTELGIDGPAGEQLLTVTVRPLRPATALADGGDPEGAIAVVRDVGELRRLERARRDFFTNVNHELKTPITAIRGAVESVLEADADGSMTEEVRHRFLTGALRSAERLGALVADLLALERLDDDPRRLTREPVDLLALVAEVAGAQRDGAAARGGVEVRTPPPREATRTPIVIGDAEGLRQAVSNLLDNAVAHSPRGGVVDLELDWEPGGAELALRVVDRGTGIPPVALDRVFERFYRVDDDRSRARGGTGIGLSIVKHVAQVHGGSVHVVSALGAGSTFTLRLPVSGGPATGTPQG